MSGPRKKSKDEISWDDIEPLAIPANRPYRCWQNPHKDVIWVHWRYKLFMLEPGDWLVEEPATGYLMRLTDEEFRKSFDLAGISTGRSGMRQADANQDEG